MHTKTSEHHQTLPSLVDSGSNLCWGWLGPACKTINQPEKSSLGINSRIPYRAADDVTNRSIVYT